MNENLLDVLLYLFENYPVSELQDAAPVRNDLDEAGFLPEEIDDAFAWLRETSPVRQQLVASPGDHAVRLFTAEEAERLSPQCQGCLHALQRHQVLSGGTREIVIDRLMALADEHGDVEDIDVEQLKWVVMMVLSNQEDDTAYARMEALLHAEDVSAAH